MNTRAVGEDTAFIPVPSRKRRRKAQPLAEELAFDKADDAASLERLRGQIARIEAELGEAVDESDKRAVANKTALEKKKARLVDQLKAAEEAIKAKELAEQSGQ